MARRLLRQCLLELVINHHNQLSGPRDSTSLRPLALVRALPPHLGPSPAPLLPVALAGKPLNSVEIVLAYFGIGFTEV